MPDGRVCPEQFRGWLYKWTNYLKGYQKRWFVLSNGLLSYYRTQEEMAHTCRGTVNLAGAFIDTIDSCNFVITNGPSQVFHLRATNEIERQRWVTALELAKAKAIKMLESDDSDDGGEDNEHDQPLVNLKDKMRELTEAHDLVLKHGHTMLRQLAEVESDQVVPPAGAVVKVKEKIALFKLTTGAMMKNAGEFIVLAQSTERRWQRAVQHERSLRVQLQENIETLASEMHGLEARCQESTGTSASGASIGDRKPHLSGLLGEYNTPLPGKPIQFTRISSEGTSKVPVKESDTDSIASTPAAILESTDGGQLSTAVSKDEDDDNEFFDALEHSGTVTTSTGTTATEGVEQIRVKDTDSLGSSSVTSIAMPMSSKAQSSGATKDKEDHLPGPERIDRQLSSPRMATDNFLASCDPIIKNRRVIIAPKPSHKLNLWSIMKNSIGKDLSKIPLPVNFNEPLSFLQRLNEDLIYHNVLNEAVKVKNSCEQICYVAAFASSSYASTVYRTGKPFNPLLGETYECDRRCEMGWRSLTEQVSHHPPACAQHVEHKDWTFWQDFTMGSKFRGKYLQIIPYGTAHLVFHSTGHHYTWSKVITYIHNIIIGKLWIDQSGDLEVTNHSTGDKCVMKFIPYSYFSRERMRRVTGKVTDNRGELHYVMKGYWDEKIEYSKVLGGTEKDLKTGPAKVIWQAIPARAGSEHMYGFSEFTCSLNEPEPSVCPTDSRLRPDQRIMEDGDFDNANVEKVRLEEKQRAKRRKREAAAAKAAEAAAQGKHEEAKQLEEESSYSPFWFHKQFDPCTNTMAYKYKGGYWEAKSKGNFPNAPDIF